MKRLSIIIAITTIAVTLSSCVQFELPKGTPDSIVSKINQLKNEAVRNPPAEVWQYDYKGETVFYIPPYCCDMFSELYDDNGNLICHPDGGFSGTGDGRCTDFGSTRTNGKLLWKDPRKY